MTDQPLFLQVETTGTSLWYDRVTMIGWDLGGQYEIAFPGSNDARLAAVMTEAETLITFDGFRLDFPFLTKQYPNLPLPAKRINLRTLLRRKYGADKVLAMREHRGERGANLWYAHRAGDPEALRRLIENNHDAVQQLKLMWADCLGSPSQEPVSILNSVDAHAWVALAGDPEPAFTYDRLGLAPNLRVVGIDLTGSESRPSGWCLMEGAHAETRRIKTDEEMLRRIADAAPALVSIDSPLSLPAGRLRVDDEDPTRAEFGINRECERVLRKRGVGVYPPLLPSMQALTARGIALAQRIRDLGVPVIEGFPGVAQDILGIPRKKASVTYLRDGLARFGILGEFQEGRVSHDELDAITVAITGLFYLAGRYEALGDEQEGCLIVPYLGETAKNVIQ
ncbi:MAG: DUF429 domain-containing protein [Capsulimonas sp.]|uniref:DUF429 domain-containing protein n=1 Tax=Capsulimonas sp. TaxID=2494211 RepID=UPI0032679D57